MKTNSFARTRFSLANQLLLFAILLGIVPTLVLAGVGLWLTSQNLQNDAFLVLREHTNGLAEGLRNTLQKKQSILEIILVSTNVNQAIQAIQNEDTSSFERENLRQQWQQLLETSGFSRLMLLDAQGSVIVSTEISDDGKIFKQETFFQEGLKTPYVSPPFYDIRSDSYLIAVAHPVKSTAQAAQGVFVGTVEFSQIQQVLVLTSLLGKTSESYLVGQNFAALTPLKFAETRGAGRIYVRTEGVQNAIQQQTENFGIYLDYRGQPVLGVYRWLPDLQLTLVTEIDQRDALANLTSFVQTSLIVLLSVLIVSIVVGILVARNISKPVINLSLSAQALAAGNLLQRTNIRRNDEIGLLSQSFDTMAERLFDLISSLEQRVADRTKALSTSLEVSRRLSAATTPRQLALDVVEQLQAAFGYYHAHIYFFDESGENLVMAGGTGEAGAAMLAAGHSIPRGRGLVGRAAETKAPVLVEDVSQAIGWLPNPLLPETQSELAVPIMQGEQVLGVIDIQQNRVGGLDENDVALLEAIAAQVAISYKNARFIEQSSQQAEFEALVNYIGQRIQRADTVEATLQTAVQELAQTLGATKAIVSLKASSEQDA